MIQKVSMLFSKEIKSRIPNGICLVTSEDEIEPNPSHFAIEEHSIANAVHKRKTEFRKGRQCARQALRLFGVAPCPIPVGRAREPIWPRNFVGSITHCPGFYAAAVTEKTKYTSIGIDVEQKKKLSFDISSQIFTRTEKDNFNLNNTIEYFPLLIFSAKESIFKCLYPMTNQYMDFLDVSLEFDRSKMRFKAKIPSFTGINTPQNTIEGIYIAGDKYLFTIAYLPPGNRSDNKTE